jgi:hypothetical protein
VMREYDEKRMERYGHLLAAKRNPAVDNYFQFQKARGAAVKQQNKGGPTPGDGKGGVGGNYSSRPGVTNSDYYKDRGRQTYR